MFATHGQAKPFLYKLTPFKRETDMKTAELFAFELYPVISHKVVDQMANCADPNQTYPDGVGLLCFPFIFATLN